MVQVVEVGVDKADCLHKNCLFIAERKKVMNPKLRFEFFKYETSNFSHIDRNL